MCDEGRVPSIPGLTHSLTHSLQPDDDAATRDCQPFQHSAVCSCTRTSYRATILYLFYPSSSHARRHGLACMFLQVWCIIISSRSKIALRVNPPVCASKTSMLFALLAQRCLCSPGRGSRGTQQQNKLLCIVPSFKHSPVIDPINNYQDRSVSINYTIADVA